MKLRNKYIIGAHVMWYEYRVVEEYIRSLINIMEEIENKPNVQIDFCFNLTEHFEKLDTDEMAMESIREHFESLVNDMVEIHGIYVNAVFKTHDDSNIYTHAHYRRDLNYNNCEHYDYIIWGESDCLLPLQLLSSMESISQYASSNNIYRYVTTFATRKMWDDSWKPLEHVDFADLSYYEKDDPRAFTEAHSIRYTMNISEMNKINRKYDEIEVQILRSPKFDGSGLVISADLIKAGANIPHGTNWMGEDTGFLYSCVHVMGEAYCQFVVKNVLKVHNRDHSEKRLHVLNLDTGNSGSQQDKGDVYNLYRDMTKKNIDMLQYKQTKFITFDDIKEKLKNE